MYKYSRWTNRAWKESIELFVFAGCWKRDFPPSQLDTFKWILICWGRKKKILIVNYLFICFNSNLTCYVSYLLLLFGFCFSKQRALFMKLMIFIIWPRSHLLLLDGRYQRQICNLCAISSPCHTEAFFHTLLSMRQRQKRPNGKWGPRVEQLSRQQIVNGTCISVYSSEH